MRKTAQETLPLFNNGLNCAQTVLSCFCEDYGLNRQTACKLANGFGNGVHSGDVCGAVAGAVMVIGLKYGQVTPDDVQAKAECNEKTQEFLNEFRDENGSILCRDLLGIDCSTKEGHALAKQRDLYNTVCREKIKSAVQLLEELGY